MNRIGTPTKDDIKKAYLILKKKYSDVQIFGDRINVITDDEQKTIDETASIFKEYNLKLTSYRTITPSLENVFIHLVKKAS